MIRRVFVAVLVTLGMLGVLAACVAVMGALFLLLHASIGF